MKKSTLHLITTILIFAILVPASMAQQTDPFEKPIDVYGLLEDAESNFDLDTQDAVILLEAVENLWTPDRRLVTNVTQVVWIRSDQGIRHYADLRVPWDSERQALEKKVLRTYRISDQAVIDAGETAVVETLPFALSRTSDYSNIRETMLLHDGVELPCIMVTEYTISDIQPFRSGFQDTWIFPKYDPVLWSSYTLGLPPGENPVVYVSEEVPEPVTGRIDSLNLNTWRYTMGPLEPMGMPHTVDPASCNPHISWSTWENWKQLGNSVNVTFRKSMRLSRALKDSVAELVRDDPIDIVKAKRISSFVNDHTHSIHYDWNWWLHNPRPAHRTFETAYGHCYDRAILAAALFKEAGFEVFPYFKSRACVDIDENTPVLSRFADIDLWISSEKIEAYFDPETVTLANGLQDIYGRTVWVPGSGEPPEMKGGMESSTIRLRMAFDSEPETGSWNVHGLYHTTGVFCAYQSMTGVDSEARDHLCKVLGKVIDDAVIEDYNPVIFDRFEVTGGYQVNVPQGEPDEFGRLPLVIGSPAGGLLDKMPPGVHTYNQHRQSPVDLPGRLSQEIRTCLPVEDEQEIILPAEKEIRNPAGSFSLKIERDDKRIVITRRISLDKSSYTAGEWPDLRALLLEEEDDCNRTILFKM